MPRSRRPAVAGQPPDPRGGPRQGVQGRQYEQRSDLRGNAQPVRVAPGQEYGKGAAQQRAQQVIPLPTQPPQQRVTADEVPNLFAPTQRPNEPITAGLPFGPGPGPRMDQRAAPNPTSDFIRGLYLRAPTPELRELIDQLDLEG